MPLTVRSAAAQDEDAVASLWRACGLVSGDKDPAADFRFARGSPSSDVLVGEDEGGRLVASVMVGHDGHRGWLYYVAADPSARGSGHGRRMVRAAEDWLRKHGIGRAQLLVLDTNVQVVSFYEHLGFAVAPRVILSKTLT